MASTIADREPDGSSTLSIFLSRCFPNVAFPVFLSVQSLFASFKISRNGVMEMTKWASPHEEAETRMMIHAKHAAASYQNVVIISEDTDDMKETITYRGGFIKIYMYISF